MKKVTAICWRAAASRLTALIPDLAGAVDLKVYAADTLSEEEFDESGLHDILSEADFLLLNESARDSVWPLITDYLTNNPKKAAYIGSDISLKNADPLLLEYSAKCNLYFTYNGKDNLINMVRYAAAMAGDETISYEEPVPLPWEGIFHPDEPEVIYGSTEEYLAKHPLRGKGLIGLLTARATYLNEDVRVENMLIRMIEEAGYDVLPFYTYSWKEDSLGTLGPSGALRKYAFDDNGQNRLSGLIKLAGFFMSGRVQDTDDPILREMDCPVFRPIASSQTTLEEWENDPDGTLRDAAWSIVMPEMEGCIEPVFIGAAERSGESERRVPIESRCRKFVSRVLKWVQLSKKPNAEKKVVFMLNNNPCASVEATVGGGAKLDAPESVIRIMRAMKEAGYAIDTPPEDGKALIRTIMEKKAISDFRWTTVGEIVEKGGVLRRITKEEYLPWFEELPENVREDMIRAWGNPPGEEIDGIPAAMVYEGTILITGLSFGNALVCVQPKRGCAGSRCDGTVCKILHDPHVPPTHQYLAAYRYYERMFGADFIIQVGTHGNLEFLPGKGTALSDSCFPDICIGSMPNLYIYNADNPPEGTIAKRRASAVLIDHMQTVYSPGGLYEELEAIDDLVQQYEAAKHNENAQSELLMQDILAKLGESSLKDQLGMPVDEEHFPMIRVKLHEILTQIRNTQIPEGMHIFGEIPDGDARCDLIYGILRYEPGDGTGLRSLTAKMVGLDFQALLGNPGEFIEKAGRTAGAVLSDLDRIGRIITGRLMNGGALDDSIDEKGIYHIENEDAKQEILALRERILDISRRIGSSDEIGSLLHAADGRYVLPGPAGVVTRGRDDILPTGRNFYTMDPSSVPTKAAWVVGQKLADGVIERFLTESGRYPETFGVYWMSNDLLWGGGEGLAQMMALLGVRPKWLRNGKVRSFDIIPLEELRRPRIDVTVKLSGILRDNFRDRMDLLDRAIFAVAALDEPEEMNFVRKHTQEAMKSGLSFEDAAGRLFGARPGTYLTGITLQIYSSAWQEHSDMTDVFTHFNGYSYSGGKYGAEAFRSLERTLKTVDITYNKVMNDEHDLLGCSCYYGAQGGMTAAARELSGRDVKAYYGDTREAGAIKVRAMSEELSRVVQARLLNPKWIEGQKAHGYKGATDISKRIGRIYGWEATTGDIGDWVFDGITRTYVENEENRRFMQENNPWAMEEIMRRLIEAKQRGLWKPADGLDELLEDAYLDIEGVLEENVGDGSETFQGGAIDINGVPVFEK